MASQGHTCRCGARWTGTRVAHCGGCHETFTTVGNFDKHRPLRDVERACRQPADVGLVRRETPAGARWHAPAALVGDDREAAQLALDGLGRRFG